MLSILLKCPKHQLAQCILAILQKLAFCVYEERVGGVCANMETKTPNFPEFAQVEHLLLGKNQDSSDCIFGRFPARMQVVRTHGCKNVAACFHSQRHTSEAAMIVRQRKL